MLYHLAYYFTSYWPALQVIHYVSFRILAGLLTTLGFSFLFGGCFIRFAKRYLRSKTRERLPERHQQKGNLPTMGGIFILSMVTLNTLLWCNLTNPAIWLMLLVMIGFGLIGAWDDWAKITRDRGIPAKEKFGLQLFVTALTVGLWLWGMGAATTITVPFFKQFQPDLGWFFFIWASFIILGCSNAVNLTDGLDGLAIGSLVPNFITFAFLCYVAGNMQWATYLYIPYAGTSEVAIVGAILVGASIGFLWYNAYPAQLFMGDVGSLALGAGLAFMALLCKQEVLLALSGGVFVAETISVILQVLSYRFRGKRIFRMAPMHHHFELIGWQEAKITMRFGIISLILCLLALLTIKMR